MRKNSLARQARRAYDHGELARICTLREDRFGRAFGMQTVSVARDLPASRMFSRDYGEPAGRPEDYYHFRDNGSAVLAVAHLDTVVTQKGRTPHFRNTERGPLITSGALDDRLGAYVILGLLPKLGVTCDWLLTVGEESGQSTAEYFDAQGKKYDHVIEFDRAGTDVVMYQYEDDASARLVEAAGAAMGSGSFSDIASLEHLSVKAFNWGVGYRGNYHSAAGYAYLDDTFAMVAKYLRFCEQNAGTAMPHDPDKRSGYYGSYYRDDNEYYGNCDVCFTKESVDSVTGYCLYCQACSDCGQIEDEGCMCYMPRHVRDEAAEPAAREWSATPEEAVRAGSTAGEARTDPARRSPSLAPPWSEHRPVSHGLGVPTSPKIDTARSYADRLRKEKDRLTARFGQARSAVSPPAVFPDADLGWHEAARQGGDGLFVVAHKPGQAWAQTCLRCAARWPHPVGSADVHPDSDCPGCDRCPDYRLATGAIHVIPAHLAGESEKCGLCRELNTGPDAAGAALREIAALTETDR